MRAEGRRSAWRWAERALLVGGFVCVAWCALVWLQTRTYQREQRDVLERAVVAAPQTAGTRATLTAGSLIGSLELPRLGLSAVVSEGDGDSTLKMAIGHLPDTPLPWEDGNSALAGHRDTFFRPLKDIRVGDELQLTTVHGNLRYRVRETLVVSPANVEVLNSTGNPSLTLITCYPFNYVGHAPRRFIVRADRIGPPADAIDNAPGHVRTATAKQDATE